MIHDGPEPEIKDGFVSIEAAERLRQQETIRSFRERHPAEFQRLLDATIGLKRAHQELDAAKLAAGALPTGLPMGDILDGVEREARAVLREAADKATAQQLAQINAEAAGSLPPATADKPAKKSKAA